jgi:hypothetical protein
MSILDKLSSQVGDRTNAADHKVAEQVLDDPALLKDIAVGLEMKDAALAADCAEVMTYLAERKPELVAPYAKLLVRLLDHKNTKVRWEAMHSLSLVTPLAPKVVAPLLPRLIEIVEKDSSTIVRDYAVSTLANYASTGKKAAQSAYPYLKQALRAADGRHAARALEGMVHVARLDAQLKPELQKVGSEYLNDRRGVTRRAAKALVKTAEEQQRTGGTRG